MGEQEKKLSAEEITRVKGLGCLRDKRYDDIFNVRVITVNGKVSSENLAAVAEAARLFGSGEVTMTARLTLEVQGVPYARLEGLFAYLKERGLETGGTGAKVRPIVSCKGTTCQYGLIDTFALSAKIHEKFYVGYRNVTDVPHKFKIAVGGCPNNCMKPELNDVGVIGQRVPKLHPDKCKNCKKCQIQQGCPVHAAAVVDGVITIDPAACNSCGRCVGKCPFDAVTEECVGYEVVLGGRWGKKTAQAVPLNRLFTSEAEVLEAIDKAFNLFRAEGIKGERFADTISRLGFDYVEKKIIG